MAQLIQAFNANEFSPQQSSGQLPVGKHPVVIDSSEVKPNKDNTGGYLQLNLKITDGPQTGATGAYRLNLYNSNQKTVEIAQRQLSAVCHVTGIFMVQDSAQLHNIPFIVEVTPQKTDPQYTEVKKVFDSHGNEPGKAPFTPAATPFAAVAPAPQSVASESAPAYQPAQPPAWGAPPAAGATATAAPAATGWQQNASTGGAVPPWGAPR